MALKEEPEFILLNPYNSNNKLISKKEIQKILGFPIYNLDIYQKAFIHKSYCKKKGENILNGLPVILADKPDDALDLQEDSNERLEFLGDSILGAVITSYLYQRFGEDEGFLTKIKTKLVNCETLASFSKCLNLDKHLVISKHVEERCNGRSNPSLLEDVFESLIGAIFIDYNNNIKITKTSKNITTNTGVGYQIAKNFIIKILESNVDFTHLIMKDTNYKDILLRYYQHTFNITPKYKEMSVDGPPHQRNFTMAVLCPDNRIVGKGTERSKKKAEQIASKQALLYYSQLEDSDESDFSDSD